MAGYKGYSMSNNAIECYQNNIRPISKWSKMDILNLIENNYSSIFQNAKKLNLNQLKELFLKLNSWHHTSCKFNKTNFYEFDYELEIEKLKNDIEDFNLIKKIKFKTKFKGGKECII